MFHLLRSLFAHATCTSITIAKGKVCKESFVRVQLPTQHTLRALTVARATFLEDVQHLGQLAFETLDLLLHGLRLANSEYLQRRPKRRPSLIWKHVTDERATATRGRKQSPEGSCCDLWFSSSLFSRCPIFSCTSARPAA